MRIIKIGEHGLPIGEDHPRAILSDREVDMLLAMHESGWGQKRLAVKFEISRRSVRDIISGRRRCVICVGHRAV